MRLRPLVAALARPAAALVAVFVLGGVPPVASGAGPTVATEDTMRTEVSPVLVRAPRVTLDEILDRVARGEARRDSLLHDEAFTATLRVVRNTAGHGKPEVFIETVSKVYKKKPASLRTIELRKYEKFPDKGNKKADRDAGDDDDFTPDMGEEAMTFAFRADNRRMYRFTIEDRRLLGDHLLYTLRFEPRSALAVNEPSGRVWVDTKDFVILRQELDFRQSPMPLFLKRMGRMVLERTQVGDFWVMSRMLIRMELTIPMPRFGSSCDFAMAFSDYSINGGLPDSLFTRAARGDRRLPAGNHGGKRS